MRFCSKLVVLVLLFPSVLHADDGAASIAVGGLVLMKREPRIVMAKEVLKISEERVVVDYDFRNDSKDNITTEVAFPIPPYVDDPDGPRWQLAGFDDFKLTVNGVPTKFQIETCAFVGKLDITPILVRMGIDAASFGHEHPDHDGNIVNDLLHLSTRQRKELVTLKAVDASDMSSPDWSVEKKYHWTQIFPAGATVHIRHEYTPVVGSSDTIGDPSVYRGKEAVWEYARSCPGPALRNTLSKVWNRPGAQEISPNSISYVSFILTTANTWKTPIEDFTLIVERPHLPKTTSYVSFCWNGPVKQTDADHFSAHVSGFLPKTELQIGFIHAKQE